MTKAMRAGSVWKDWGVAMLCLAVVLGYLFRQSFESEKVLFSNDAPLGLVSSKAGVSASTFEGIVSGFWQDLNWIGIEMPSVLPGLSWGIFQIIGANPVANAKFYAPLSFLFLGFCAWLLFRTLGFRNVVCVIGALAAALNMNSFSHGAWGLPTRALSWGSAMLAIAALYSSLRGRPWIKAILAGMCVGLGIVEAFDVGALYSLYIAAFGIFLAFARPQASERVKSVALVVVVAISAALFSAQALSTLIGTQVKGVVGMEQTDEARAKRWDEATGWSLPKAETLRVIIPGLFGYRMDSPNGGAYWGSVGFPIASPRHSGAGEYAGILVVLIGVFGAANAFRKQNNPYSDIDRRAVKFWICAALISIVFAWGRWAPFYQPIYKLPFFSTIRNPIKFMHFFHLSLLILFGYGLQVIFAQYVNTAAAKISGSPMDQFKTWFAKAAAFDRKFVYILAAGLIVSFFGFLMYSSSKADVAKYLETVGFPSAPGSGAPAASSEIVAFSLGEVGYYLLFYVLSLVAILLCLSGFFSGTRARWAAIIIGAVLIIDMARANERWIIYYNYKERYASNPVLDFLQKDSVDHRATMFINPFYSMPLAAQRSQESGLLSALASEWLQNQFQFYNIQSCDIIQFPRRPELDEAFHNEFSPTNTLASCVRFWELSNTRYLIGQRGFEQALNQQFDANKGRFSILTNFNYKPKPGLQQATSLNDLTWEFDPNGPLSIIEFNGALPRYSLYSHWQTIADDSAALKAVNSPTFNPQQELIVNDSSAPPGSGATNGNKVELVRYEPKKIQVKAYAGVPSILLWNDRWSVNWHAFVDGAEVKLLRCNYIMRGVQIPVGPHQIEMRYAQPAKLLWVSFATLAVGIGLCLFLAFDSRKAQPQNV
jgi:hypothetical protein